MPDEHAARIRFRKYDPLRLSASEAFQSQEDAAAAARKEAAAYESPCLYVHETHNPDVVRTFYEIPDAVAESVRPPDDQRTFVEALTDLLTER